jgi:hypothetical protein
MNGYFARISQDELEGLKGGEDLEVFLSRIVEDEDRCLDVDKAWAGIHFLLCDGRWEGTGPLFSAVLGGEPLGDDDVGHGPARFLLPSEVAAVAAALQRVDFASLRELFRSAVLGNPEVYPGLEDDEDFNYLEYNFLRLRGFYEACAGSGQALLLFIA